MIGAIFLARPTCPPALESFSMLACHRSSSLWAHPHFGWRAISISIQSKPRRRYNAKTAVHELQMLLDDQSYSDRATEVGKVVSQEQGACVAADEIEKVLQAS